MFTRLFIGNVAYTLDDATLTTELMALGLQIKSMRILKDRETGHPRGFGFFEVPADQAELAMQLADGVEIHGRYIRVAPATQQDRDKPSGDRRPTASRGPRPKFENHPRSRAHEQVDPWRDDREARRYPEAERRKRRV